MSAGKVLVVIAHPDDEIYGMGGTLEKLRQEGNSVNVVVVFSKGKDEKETSRRNNIFKQVSDLYSFDYSVTLDLLTQSKSYRDLDNISDAMWHIINNIHPDTIFTHYAEDKHRDHRFVSEAVYLASRPERLGYAPQLLYFGIPGSTRDMRYNVYYTLTQDMIDKKAMASKLYFVEAPEHPRSTRNLKSLAQTTGSYVSAHFAEGFVLERQAR